MKSTRQKINDILGLPHHGVTWANLSLEGDPSAIQSTKTRLDGHFRQQGNSVLGDLRYANGVGVAYGPRERDYSFFRGTVEIATDHELTMLVVQYMSPGVQLGWLPLRAEMDRLKEALPEFMYARTPQYCSIDEILMNRRAA